MQNDKTKKREVMVGSIGIGGNNPIRVQSMTSTKTVNIQKTEEQIQSLTDAGCEIVRLAIPDKKSLNAFKVIRKDFPNTAFVADIHFNYMLAINAIEEGADKVRINPGNIGSKEHVKDIVEAAKLNKKSIRIGVNSGSLEIKLIDKYKGPTPMAMLESAMKWINYIKSLGFFDIVVSAKSSSVRDTIEIYELLNKNIDLPLHIGVTEAGTFLPGTVKSSIAIGYLLYNNIGDTIRVSLTDDPVKEVEVAWEILKSLGIRYNGPILISCPTCARTRVNLIELARKVELMLREFAIPVKVAVMGCEVNGPGEAREADLGVAAEPGYGLIFRQGKPIRRVEESRIVEELRKELNKLKEQYNG